MPIYLESTSSKKRNLRAYFPRPVEGPKKYENDERLTEVHNKSLD